MGQNALPAEIDTVIVGGGQAGLAASEHLGRRSIAHIVLERARIAESWRSMRWDSLVMNGPAWHDRFPSLAFDCPPDAFPGKDEVAQYMERYAQKIAAPIHCGIEVVRAARAPGHSHFQIDSSQGQISARSVIAATGPFQTPIIPPILPVDAGPQQIHSSQYRNPDQLAPGAVLVVGAGSSGAQIAQELAAAGRQVYLSVGAHDRPPRRYRGRDFVWWLGVLGKWNADTPTPGTAHVTIAVSGTDGGHTVDFRRMAHNGVVLVGMTEAYRDGRVTFAGDLAENIARGDANYLSVLDQADAYITAHGLDLPPEPEARILPPDPECLRHPIRALDLQKAKIGTVIWATGFRQDFSWLEADTFDAQGRPQHQRGVGRVPGVYFLGLPWLTRRGSAFIWGVWHDAKFIADQIAIQRGYDAYSGTAAPVRPQGHAPL
mgnify:FL=1